MKDLAIIETKKEDEKVIKCFKALPTEDDLPYDDGEPMETSRHTDQMNVPGSNGFCVCVILRKALNVFQGLI